MTYSDHEDSKIKDMRGPTLTGSEADFNGARSSGLFAPEQQSFLGASIQSFSVQNGDGSTPASLNVDLVEDPSFNNYVITALPRLESAHSYRFDTCHLFS